MGRALNLFMFMQLFPPLSSLLASSQSPVPPPQLGCHDDERSALLDFKASTRSNDPRISCLDSWELGGGEARNCCSWQGVTCGGPDGQVIGLNLGQCYLYGSLNSSSSIFRLVHLQELYLFSNYFYGAVSPSVSNLTQLVTLSLSSNSLEGPILPSISNLARLVTLDLTYNQFSGDIPPSLTNLVQLTFLYLRSNQFTGEIPYRVGSLTHLKELDLYSNRVHGEIPSSISQLRNLTILRLGRNNLSGMVQLEMFSRMDYLQELILSFNEFSLAIGSTDAHSLPNVRILGLARCNLTEFPGFLSDLDKLAQLDLSSNNLSGQVPEWFLNVSLQTLNLSGNSLTGFPRDLSNYSSPKLNIVDLRSNKLQGSFPVLSTTPMTYLVSDNMFSGEIPQQICDWVCCLQFLDLSRNNFTGELPQCLSEFASLAVLILHSNNFQGKIPLFGSNNSCALEMIDLSDNRLQGPLPRSLSNCSNLSFLNAGNNRINDTFPSSLGSLPSLTVLILRSNYFHGVIQGVESGPGFPKLRIIDLSRNNFRGSLYSLHFQNWTSIGESGPEENSYLSAYMFSSWVFSGEQPSYDFSMTIINKGVEMEYEKILVYFKVADLSSNDFTGEIPDSIASLKGLHLLNLSNNLLTGPIRPSLGSLTELEALDLSRNQLSGEIPPQLTKLTFLSVFNVSFNNLSGVIPQGKQFDSFENNSYLGNTGLCGDPSSTKCASPEPPKNAENDEGSDVPFEIEWRAVVVGYACTFVIAAIIGHKVISIQPDWFSRTFRLRHPPRRR